MRGEGTEPTKLNGIYKHLTIDVPNSSKGWLMKIEGFDVYPYLQQVTDDRWYTVFRPLYLFFPFKDAIGHRTGAGKNVKTMVFFFNKLKTHGITPKKITPISATSLVQLWLCLAEKGLECLVT